MSLSLAFPDTVPDAVPDARTPQTRRSKNTQSISKLVLELPTTPQFPNPASPSSNLNSSQQTSQPLSSGQCWYPPSFPQKILFPNPEFLEAQAHIPTQGPMNSPRPLPAPTTSPLSSLLPSLPRAPSTAPPNAPLPRAGMSPIRQTVRPPAKSPWQLSSCPHRLLTIASTTIL